MTYCFLRISFITDLLNAFEMFSKLNYWIYSVKYETVVFIFSVQGQIGVSDSVVLGFRKHLTLIIWGGGTIITLL